MGVLPGPECLVLSFCQICRELCRFWPGFPYFPYSDSDKAASLLFVPRACLAPDFASPSTLSILIISYLYIPHPPSPIPHIPHIPRRRASTCSPTPTTNRPQLPTKTPRGKTPPSKFLILLTNPPASTPANPPLLSHALLLHPTLHPALTQDGARRHERDRANAATRLLEVLFNRCICLAWPSRLAIGKLVPFPQISACYTNDADFLA